uniref:Uncharacterized protein n=1 Tax=Varanus komodoensis TaxID=61221 RepID=A0A8D2LBU5_VARKO
PPEPCCLTGCCEGQMKRRRGIAFSNGEKWKTLRRFALHALKNFGMGRRSIEVRIQEEAQCLVQEFRKTGGAPFNPLDLVCRAVSNVICAVVFGRRFDYEDAAFLVLLNHLNDNFRIMSSAWGELYNIFPRLMDFLPGPHHQIFRNFEKLRQFIAERIRQHQRDLNPREPQDFIDCFLVRMEQEKQDPLSHFHMETLVMTTHNLFFGGTETTSTTLRYSFLILMKHPEVAARVHEEIDRVIGPERTPCLADRKHMPYTDAVLYEVQRFISILPMGLPRAVTRDTPFRGYLLPKSLLAAAHSGGGRGGQELNDSGKRADERLREPHGEGKRGGARHVQGADFFRGGPCAWKPKVSWRPQKAASDIP